MSAGLVSTSKYIIEMGEGWEFQWLGGWSGITLTHPSSHPTTHIPKLPPFPLSISSREKTNLLWFFCLAFVNPLCASVYMCLVVTCWERADLLALVCGVLL